MDYMNSRYTELLKKPDTFVFIYYQKNWHTVCVHVSLVVKYKFELC